MDEPRHITDPNGKHRPVLDQHGNMSAEVLRLYANSLLNSDDAAAVERALADDPFASEAMEGFKGLSVDKLNAHLNGISAAVSEKLGTEVVTVIEEDRPFMRLAAALLVLVGLGGATYYALQYLPTDQIVAFTQTKETPPASPHERQAPQPLETPRPLRPSFDVSGQTMTEHEVAVVVEDLETDDATAEVQTTATAELDNQPGTSAEGTKSTLANVKTAESVNQKAVQTAQTNASNASEGMAMAAKALPAPPAQPLAEQRLKNENLAQTSVNTEILALRKDSGLENEKKKADKKAEEKAKEQSRTAAAPRQQAKAELAATPPMSEEERGRLPLFNQVEQAPKFPGGDLEMYRYLENNRGYQNASETNSGNVYISFVIDEQGRVRSPEVSRGINPELDADALRLISKMPNWEPAIDGGKPAAVRKTVMVKYR